MRLEKYYWDVVTDDGAGAIGYAARIRGAGIPITLGATLRWNGPDEAGTANRRTWRGRLPERTSTGGHWHCPALRATVHWQGVRTPQDEITLWHDAGGGGARWQVLAPAAEMEFQIDGHVLRGRGYVECLRLDVAPWRLPIDELRWGRFIAPGHAVVWIEWLHDTRRAWCFHNGVPVQAACSDQAVRWPGGRLELERRQTLRSGRLGQTAFGRWPTLRALLPRRIRDYDETKWCASGTLHLTDGAAASGWAVHERVIMR